VTSIGVDLFWLPLGAGGRFVRFNGRLYEWITARRDHRIRQDLYHTALEVRVPEGRYIIENAWPIPDRNPAERGVTVQGPVWSPHLGRFRIFRYEVRCWLEGTIPDVAEAVASPERISDDEAHARAVLAATETVPTLIWGRDEMGMGEMWNSNSVIAYVLTRADIPAIAARPPAGGRAPGWMTGVLFAQRSMPSSHEGVPSPSNSLP
jgi:hypothetical protein